jgi:hypothetical protein
MDRLFTLQEMGRDLAKSLRYPLLPTDFANAIHLGKSLPDVLIEPCALDNQTGINPLRPVEIPRTGRSNLD